MVSIHYVIDLVLQLKSICCIQLFIYFTVVHILNLVSFYQYVKELNDLRFQKCDLRFLILKSSLFDLKSNCGEYRSRTDDLLRARQAL